MHDRLPPGSLSSDLIDTVFDLLGSTRRRALLYFFYDAGTGEFPVERVVEGVREYESAVVGDETLPPRQTVRTELLHAHLPRLAQVGAVEVDVPRGTVRFSGYPPLEPWLKQLRHLELG